MNITINTTAGAQWALAASSQRKTLDTAPIWRVRINAVANELYTSCFGAEYLARRALKLEDKPATQLEHTEYQLLSFASEMRDPSVPEATRLVYAANLAAVRAYTRDGAFDVARDFAKEFEPFALEPGYARVAIQTPVLVTVGIVGVVAALAAAVAWWSKGKNEAVVNAQSSTIKQGAAVNALTQIALGYAARGEKLPPEVADALRGLGGNESARVWAVPLALSLPFAGLAIGGGYGLATRKSA